MGLQYLCDITNYGNWTAFTVARQVYINYLETGQYPLVYLLTPDSSLSEPNNISLIWEPYPTVLNSLRNEEYSSYTCNNDNEFEFISVWSIK